MVFVYLIFLIGLSLWSVTHHPNWDAQMGLLFALCVLGWLNHHSYGPNSQANIKVDCNMQRKISSMLKLMYTPPSRCSRLSRKSVSPFVRTRRGVKVEHFEQRLWPVTQEQRYLFDDTDF